MPVFAVVDLVRPKGRTRVAAMARLSALAARAARGFGFRRLDDVRGGRLGRGRRVLGELCHLLGERLDLLGQLRDQGLQFGVFLGQLGDLAAELPVFSEELFVGRLGHPWPSRVASVTGNETVMDGFGQAESAHFFRRAEESS